MIEQALKNIVCAESEAGTWEIVTESPIKDKDVTLLFFQEDSEPVKQIHITFGELNDLINFLDRLQGR